MLAWVGLGTSPVLAAPTSLECNSNLFVVCSSSAGAPVNYPHPAGGFAVACLPPSGSVFPLGVTVVRCVSHDADGATSTCKFLVTVTRTPLPSLLCPDYVVVRADSGRGAATDVPLGFARASDSSQLHDLANDAPAEFPIGTNLVTWTATDEEGNRMECRQRVVVRDDQPPVMTLPQVVERLALNGRGAISRLELEPPAVTDNHIVAGCTNDAPVELRIGTHQVRWIATDLSGNLVAAEQVVIVRDVHPPLLECPPDRVTEADPGRDVATDVDLGIPQASDNDAVQSVQSDAAALYGAGRDWWWVDPMAGDDAAAVRGDYRQAFATLAAALRGARDGDTIVMLPGTNFIRCSFFTTNTPELFINRSNLTIIGQPGATLVATNLGDGILCSGAANLKLTGLTLRGYRTNNDVAPVQLWTGIHIQGGCDGAEIAYNRLDDWMDQGIAVLNGDSETSTNVWVHDNFITRCGFTWRTTNGFFADRFDGAAIVPDAGWIVESNRVEDCAMSIEIFPTQNLPARPATCVVRHNFLRNNLAGISGGNNLCPVLITGNTVVNATNYSWVVDSQYNPWVGFADLGSGWFSFGVVFQGHYEDVTVTSNIISGWRIGICAVEGSLTNAVLAGNLIAETTQAGILVGPNYSATMTRNLLISGNVITNARSVFGEGGIEVFGVADSTITGNSVSGDHSAGVVIQATTPPSTNVIVRDTRLEGSYNWGIVIAAGGQAARIVNTGLDAADIRYAAYCTNGAEVAIAHGAPELPPLTLALPTTEWEPWTGLPSDAGLGDDGPLEFPLGTNIVTWTATDVSGNAATCEQQVIVLARTSPVGLCDNLRVPVQSNCAAVVRYTLPALAGESDTNGLTHCDPPPGTAFPVGTTTVRCWAVDGMGQTSQCSFNVTVEPPPLPPLTIQPNAADGLLIVAWPQTCGEVLLERSSDLLDPEGWSLASWTPVLEDGVFRVTITALAASRFYRLRRL